MRPNILRTLFIILIVGLKLFLESDNHRVSLKECLTLEFSLCGPQSNIIKPWQFIKIDRNGDIVEMGFFTLLLKIHMDPRN